MIPQPSPSNAPEWSVSELAGALKRTLEDAYGYVRLRGEISGYRGPHSSGHAYFSLKDETACIDAVIWKTSFNRLRIKPQQGLEVVVTGRITTFPGKSKYQIIVDTLEPAGVGALMALLEERRRKLTAEGLFAQERKRKLPFLPRVVGIVTSPTGAVIRDILHRLADRFPRDVLVWPVRVQGETSADEVAAAIRGFNALPAVGPLPRPDVLIVARGGGSFEDLWSFNEESVVRAAAESAIPLIAAIGHETDWTLIDLAADMRAPTPTGAAEMVVPVRSELVTSVRDLGRRHEDGMLRGLETRRSELRSAARALPSPDALFAAKRQRLDLASAKLKPALAHNARDHHRAFDRACRDLLRFSPTIRVANARSRFERTGEQLRPSTDRLIRSQRDHLDGLAKRLRASRGALERAEKARIERCRERLASLTAQAQRGITTLVQRKQDRVNSLGALLGSLGYRAVLARGYALVRDHDGRPLRSAAAVGPAQPLAIEFGDGTVKATSEGVKARRKDAGAVQKSLFDG
ncbi:MAG TPA: exodeoxyribonuclease VII large subunit [Beijerinckiaceae bacterium]|jgi:exodeoxyribonuclease VII large subunit